MCVARQVVSDVYLSKSKGRALSDKTGQKFRHHYTIKTRQIGHFPNATARTYKPLQLPIYKRGGRYKCIKIPTIEAQFTWNNKNTLPTLTTHISTFWMLPHPPIFGCKPVSARRGLSRIWQFFRRSGVMSRHWSTLKYHSVIRNWFWNGVVTSYFSSYRSSKNN